MIYFDHAATTPLDEKALEAMMPFLTREYGNPSSLHDVGRAAKAAITRAREKVAQTLNADPKEIIFTSGGTESVNAVHKGLAFARRGQGGHILISSIEHHCVLDCADWLSHNGFEVTQVPVDAEGRVDPRDVEKAVRKETFLISIMAANNEVGTLQPFQEIGKMAGERGILFHTDAVQAYGKIPMDAQADPVDFLSISAHKIYGPKGTGFLYLRRGVELAPLLHGGGQERDFRGGTENVAGIVGLGEAALRVCGDMGEAARLMGLEDGFLEELRESRLEFKINGPLQSERRLPGLLNLTFPGLEGEALVHGLDAKGLAASSGAACAAGASFPSHVLLAMGRSPRQAKEGLRLSFGKSNTMDQVRQLAAALVGVVKNFQNAPSFL